MKATALMSVCLLALVFWIVPIGHSQGNGPAGYTYCAGEDGKCAFSGTRTVAYGANGMFVYKTITNGTDCFNSVFGDPAPGARKACFTQNPSGGTASSAGNPTGPAGGDVFGPRQDGFALSGTYLTYYARPTVDQCQSDCAANGNCKGYTWIRAGAYNPADPAMCYLIAQVTGRSAVGGNISAVKGAGNTGAVPANPAPAAPPVTASGGTGGPAGYTLCAGEDGRCSFSGTTTVAYGANGAFFYRTITNGTDCFNSVFGDPAPGLRKACYTQSVQAGGATGRIQGAGTNQANQACQDTQRFNQPEQRDAYGRISVAAAVIHVLNCAGTQFYVYQYVNTATFRTIRPPDYGHAIGGRDFSTLSEAITAAAAASSGATITSGGVGGSAAGTWAYSTDADMDGLTTGVLSMTQDASGKLTGTFQNNGGLDGEVNGNQKGNVVTLNIHPKGWGSDFVVNGSIVSDGGGLRIVGPVDHYGKKANITIARR